jgi:hypothetical protein
MYRTESAIFGTIAGAVIGFGSYLFLIPNRLYSISICLLYSIGVFLLLDHIRILGRKGDSGGSWWGIAFGGIIGTALIVLQEVYTPVEVSAVGVIDIPAENVAELSMEFTIMLYLFVFSIALVSLNIGLGMAIADLNDG